MHKIKSGKGRTQSPVLKLPSIAFLFLTEVLKSGHLGLQTVFFAFASIFRYITGMYFFPVCGLSLHFLNSILKARIFYFMKLNCGVEEDS